jgi:putative ABC transport system permease protein
MSNRNIIKIRFHWQLKMRDYFILAFRNLRHRGIRSWLTLLGIFIGVMVVVALISLGSGLQAAVSSQFGISDTNIISITAGGISSAGPPGTGVSNKLKLDYVSKIERIANVERVLQRILATGKMKYRDSVNFGTVISVPDGNRKLFYDVLNVKPMFGRLLQGGDGNKILVGYNFWKESGVFDGESVKVGKIIEINDKTFEVVGILEKKGSFIFDNIVYMGDKDARELFDYQDNTDLIAVKVKDAELINKTKIDIERVMRELRDVKIGEEDFDVSTPGNMLENVNNILNGVQAFIVIIALISILVGAVGIVNTMTTSVLERKKDIGIMKAVGARNSQIFMQFLVESGLLGLIGGMLGCLGGIGVGVVGVAGLSNWIGGDIEVSVNYVLVAIVLVGSFVIGAVAGIAPAMRAAKQNPVEALKG